MTILSSPLTPNKEWERSMRDKHQVIEEPDEKKFSRPVLKESSGKRFPVRLYLLANHKLASSIGDMGFYEFRRQLEYKCQLYGSKLVFVDRFYPSSKTCSNCGHVKKSLSLSQRVFKCDECQFECDRDFNASINLEKAVSLVVSACGLDNADVSRMKQEEDVSNCSHFWSGLKTNQLI